jgi:hypothetical protein
MLSIGLRRLRCCLPKQSFMGNSARGSDGRFEWNPTVRNPDCGQGRWARRQPAFDPLQLSKGRQPGDWKSVLEFRRSSPARWACSRRG